MKCQKSKEGNKNRCWIVVQMPVTWFSTCFLYSNIYSSILFPDRFRVLMMKLWKTKQGVIKSQKSEPKSVHHPLVLEYSMPTFS